MDGFGSRENPIILLLLFHSLLLSRCLLAKVKHMHYPLLPGRARHFGHDELDARVSCCAADVVFVAAAPAEEDGDGVEAVAKGAEVAMSWMVPRGQTPVSARTARRTACPLIEIKG